MKKYLISSERSYRRYDECDVVFNTTRELKEGDIVVLDGLRWFVTKVL